GERRGKRGGLEAIDGAADGGVVHRAGIAEQGAAVLGRDVDEPDVEGEPEVGALEKGGSHLGGPSPLQVAIELVEVEALEEDRLGGDAPEGADETVSGDTPRDET